MKKGYPKIRETCRLAQENSFQYAWIDTCCIDKTSSAELTEAINSMFMWYQRSSMCIVYLSDLCGLASLDAELCVCRWFKRGWTLQELIAPKKVTFYDKDWSQVGTKESLVAKLAEISGIHRDAISCERPLSEFALAQRMSWAACRETTRVEDMAYCLLGIFEINMPLLYGEGNKAFHRLQEEIIRTTPDYSIFAWKGRSDSGESKDRRFRRFSSVLATSAKEFSHCGTFTVLTTSSNRANESSVTNQGIKVQARLRLKQSSWKRGTPYLLPVCYQGAESSLGIRLRKYGPNQFVRENPDVLETLDQSSIWDSTAEEKYLLAQPIARLFGGVATVTNQMIIQRNRARVFQLHLADALTVNFAYPSSRYDDEDMVFFLPGREDRGCDGIAATLDGRMQLTLGAGPVNVAFSCFFYAFGWDPDSTESSNAPQCTILNYRKYDSALNYITSQLVQHDQNSLETMDNMLYHKIPRCSTAIFNFPKSRLSVVVSLVMERKINKRICPDEFWRVKFTCKEYTDNQTPRSQLSPWNLTGMNIESEELFEIAE